jgi:TolB protein
MPMTRTSPSTPLLSLLSRASRLGLALVFALACLPAFAQMRIDVSGVGANQFPIAVATFRADGGPLAVDDVVRGDLLRSGAFRLVDPQATVADNATPDFAGLRGKGADSVLAGSVVRLADGRYDVRVRLSDVVRQTQIAAASFVAPAADLRFAGHRVADWVYEKITGERGIFSTRIAFVSRQGTRYRLNVADWDGENVQSPLTSSEPIISPSWSPDGNRIAYVSFESRKPIVYVHTLSTGTRTVVANYKGDNSAPSWSPDGRTLAVTLSRDGPSQVFLVSADGSGQPRRITRSNGIDTEPQFSSDGRNVYFTSDRGGSPQIYRMSADGGDATRVTFGSPYSVSPRISPDGRQLAYVTRRDGRFLVAIRDLSTAAEQILSDGGSEESPSFAPNGRWIMYATRSGGRESLMAVSTDGRIKQRLSSPGSDIREPTWGPFPR